MSNFMPLGQLITDLINTLLLAILKATAGRLSLYVGVGGRWWQRHGDAVLVCLCVIAEQARKGCQHVHPSQQHPSLMDAECVFQAVSQERRLRVTCFGCAELRCVAGSHYCVFL